jgi:uncharacterized protein (UPF0261 family)
MSTVVLVGSLDTKGEEYRFARDRLRSLGVDPITVDTGILGSPAFAAEVAAAEVAAAAGTTLEQLRSAQNRADALAAMGRGAAVVLGRLRSEHRLDGVLALGGSGNTTVAASAFRTLPVGVPKLILSTMTAGNIRAFVADSDLVMAASVVDIAGLNRISRAVIANAVAAIAGMVTAPPVTGHEDRPLIAASMIGLTTRAVTAARQRLEQLGYEVLVFHMTGTGGATMESIINRGLVAGVLDLTTSELADELGDGVCQAGPGRLTAAARHGIPQVVAPGGMDMINFGRPDTVPERYAGRRLHVHNSEITLVRTSATESAELGRWLAERVSGRPVSQTETTSQASAAAPATARGPAGGIGGTGSRDLRSVILLPSGGLSAIDTEGHPFYDADADTALASAVRATADHARVRIVDVPGNIDRAEFGCLAANLLHDMIAARNPSPAASCQRHAPASPPASHSIPGDEPCTR